jgi:hypothetical protein
MDKHLAPVPRVTINFVQEPASPRGGLAFAILPRLDEDRRDAKQPGKDRLTRSEQGARRANRRPVIWQRIVRPNHGADRKSSSQRLPALKNLNTFFE